MDHQFWWIKVLYVKSTGADIVMPFIWETFKTNANILFIIGIISQKG